MGQSRPLFVYFRYFLITISIIEKSIDGVLGIRTWGRRMVGADKTTELWRPLPCSVTRWPVYLLNIWQLIGRNICQSLFNFLPYTKWTLSKWPKLLKSTKSCKISPNLVTLLHFKPYICQNMFCCYSTQLKKIIHKRLYRTVSALESVNDNNKEWRF